MYHAYCAESGAGVEMLTGQTGFIRMVKMLKRTDWKRKGSIDYMLTNLVHENVADMKKLLLREARKLEKEVSCKKVRRFRGSSHVLRREQGQQG